MDAKEACRLIEEWVSNHSGEDAAAELMCLLTSLYNGEDFPFALSSCIRSLDETRTGWAKAIVCDYMDRRENATEIMELGRKWAEKTREVEEAPVLDWLLQAVSQLPEDEKKAL